MIFNSMSFLRADTGGLGMVCPELLVAKQTGLEMGKGKPWLRLTFYGPLHADAL